MQTPAERFEAKVDRSGGPDACHPWTGRVERNGYAVFYPVRTTHVGAHRYAWELINGPIPEGADLDHTCHNGTDCKGGPTCPHRRCCNDRHLEPTTAPDNNDRTHNWTGHRTHCRPGNHKYTPENTKWQRPKRPGYRPTRACRECIRIRERAVQPKGSSTP
jgi:hypothetical protein